MMFPYNDNTMPYNREDIVNQEEDIPLHTPLPESDDEPESEPEDEFEDDDDDLEDDDEDSPQTDS